MLVKPTGSDESSIGVNGARVKWGYPCVRWGQAPRGIWACARRGSETWLYQELERCLALNHQSTRKRMATKNSGPEMMR